MDDKLKNLYYDENSKVYLGSTRALYNFVKKDGYTYNYVKNWLANQEGNQILSIPKKIYYPPILGEKNDYQADLMFLPTFKRQNDGYYIILGFIELTSRKVYAYPLKNKNISSITEAYSKFLESINGKINNLTTDNGSEFIAKEFKALDKKYDIEHYFVDANVEHTSLGKIERWNRTIRGKITKYQKTYKTLRWIDVFDKLIEAYNNTVHSSTNIAPNDVNEKQMEQIRAKDRVKRDLAVKLLNLFQVGDKVRVLKQKDKFAKGTKTFSKGIYVIEKIDKLAVILSKNGHTINKRFKPYNLKLAENTEKAPENPTIIKHSNKQNKKEVKFINKQNREEAFDVVNQDNGQVIIQEKLLPEKQKRNAKEYPKLGDTVSSIFNMPDGSQMKFIGVVEKVNPKTYKVKFSDGDVRYMKKDEVLLVKEESDEIPKKEKKSEIKPIAKFKERDQVKASFKDKSGNITSYKGVLEKITRTGLHRVRFEDGDVQYMRESELEKI